MKHECKITVIRMPIRADNSEFERDDYLRQRLMIS